MQRTTAEQQPTSLGTEALDGFREALLRLEQYEVERHAAAGGPAEGGRREILDAVRDALARIEAGTYGTCTACERPIEPARLDALPYVRRCVSCQRDLEHA